MHTLQVAVAAWLPVILPCADATVLSHGRTPAGKYLGRDGTLVRTLLVGIGRVWEVAAVPWCTTASWQAMQGPPIAEAIGVPIRAVSWQMRTHETMFGCPHLALPKSMAAIAAFVWTLAHRHWSAVTQEGCEQALESQAIASQSGWMAWVGCTAVEDLGGMGMSGSLPSPEGEFVRGHQCGGPGTRPPHA
jgi:hypothetical protein